MAADIEDQLTWFVRFAILFVTITALVIILAAALPDIDTTELRAESAAARVAHNGGFWETLGVVDRERFTQETADQHYVFSGETAPDIAIRANLTRDGTPLAEAITYNTGSWKKLEPLRRASDVSSKTWTLPVTVDEEAATLTVEVLYAE